MSAWKRSQAGEGSRPEDAPAPDRPATSDRPAASDKAAQLLALRPHFRRELEVKRVALVESVLGPGGPAHTERASFELGAPA